MPSMVQRRTLIPEFGWNSEKRMIEVICGVILISWAVLANIRLELVIRLRREALDTITRLMCKSETRYEGLTVLERFEDSPSMGMMMLDLRKWKYEHFFPYLEGK